MTVSILWCDDMTLHTDEIDSLVTNRDTAHGTDNSASVESRVLATLLTEMDGVLHTPGYASADVVTSGRHCSYDDVVYVFATTNRLESIDAALLRKVCHALTHYTLTLSLKSLHSIHIAATLRVDCIKCCMCLHLP